MSKPSCKDGPPRIFIIIENPSKSNNLGPILRCGAAYSATFVFIGYQKCAIEGSHGANKHVEIVAFPTFQQGRAYVQSCGVRSIIGILGDASFKTGADDDSRVVRVCQDAFSGSAVVNASGEIYQDDHSGNTGEYEYEYPSSKPIHLRPFEVKEDICFLISKKPVGLPRDQGQVCDAFVHISTSAPILSSTEIAVYGLLDSQTSLSICLHHFAAFAGYKERDFVGQKFKVADRSGFDEETSRMLKEERMNKKLEAGKDADDAWDSGEMAETMMNLFS